MTWGGEANLVEPARLGALDDEADLWGDIVVSANTGKLSKVFGLARGHLGLWTAGVGATLP
jgi:hypothetical protein